MGLLGIDANSSSSKLTQAQVTTQTGNAVGGAVGSRSVAASAPGTFTVGGPITVKKGGSISIINTTTSTPTSGNTEGTVSGSGELSSNSLVSTLLNELQNNQSLNTLPSNSLVDALNSTAAPYGSLGSAPHSTGADFTGQSAGNFLQQNGAAIAVGLVAIIALIVVFKV